jgi:type II secretory pathway pseudopilin PulG
MIEVIVVIIILGVMAAAIVPRFFGNEARAAEIEARQVKDFLDVIASRTALSSQGLALSYDAAHKRLDLYALRARGDAGDFSASRDFLPDPMTLPVRLQHTALSALTAGGQPVDPAKGWVEFAAGAPRPTIVLVLRFDDSAAWRIELPADEPQALLARTDLRDTGDPQMSRSVDLDASGATQQPW